MISSPRAGFCWRRRNMARQRCSFWPAHSAPPAIFPAAPTSASKSAPIRVLPPHPPAVCPCRERPAGRCASPRCGQGASASTANVFIRFSGITTRLCFTMRYLSIWLPTLPTDRIRRRWRKAHELATTAKIGNAQRLVAVDAEAARCGLKPGMMLADARGMLPKLVCLPADPEGEAQTLTDITDWCRRFTPLAALDAPDGVMLDVTGAAHLFGGEEKLLADIESRLAAQGFAARAALAPTAEAAWALARFSQERLGQERH